MSFPPTLTTPRLLLRPFTPDDAPAVQAHLQVRDVADTTAMIPHPYPEGGAAAWIGTHEARHDAGEAAVLAVILRDEAQTLVGSIELRIEMSHLRGELGYWIGRAHWGRGYATEAADALLRWGIRVLGLHRVHAAHLSRNPASGAVLRKIGMRHEGSLRGHVRKWDVMEDLEVWGLLEDELPARA